MATYRLSRENGAASLRLRRRMMAWFALSAAAAALRWGNQENRWVSMVTVWAVVAALLSGGMLWYLGRWTRRRASGEWLGELAVGPEGVRSRQTRRPEQFLARAEITGFEEKRSGLFIRTADPRRVIGVSSELENFGALRAELEKMGWGPLQPRNLWRVAASAVAPTAVVLACLAAMEVLNRPGPATLAAAGMMLAVGWAGWRGTRCADGVCGASQRRFAWLLPLAYLDLGLMRLEEIWHYRFSWGMRAGWAAVQLGFLAWVLSAARRRRTSHDVKFDG